MQEQVHEIADEYGRDADDDRPLAAYAGLLSAYAVVFGALAFVGRHRLPGRLPLSDLVMGSIATHKLSRRLASEPITSPLRAPFTRFEGVQGPSELAEDARGTGWRHAVGELITCPFCIAQWIATLIVVGLSVAPRFTRTMLSILTLVSVSDVLQFAYAKAQQSADQS